MEDYRHPLLQKRNQLDFQQKLQTLMDRDGIDALIVLNPQHIYYATGYLSKAGAMPGLMPGLASVAMVPPTSRAKSAASTFSRPLPSNAP